MAVFFVKVTDYSYIRNIHIVTAESEEEAVELIRSDKEKGVRPTEFVEAMPFPTLSGKGRTAPKLTD
jgi:hypothetical protein